MMEQDLWKVNDLHMVSVTQLPSSFRYRYHSFGFRHYGPYEVLFGSQNTSGRKGWALVAFEDKADAIQVCKSTNGTEIRWEGQNFKIEAEIALALGNPRCHTDHLWRLPGSATRTDGLCLHLELEIAWLPGRQSPQEFLIRNLPESTTRHELRKFFRAYGKTVVCVPCDSDGRSWGFASIYFKDVPAAKKACQEGKDIILRGSVLTFDTVTTVRRLVPTTPLQARGSSNFSMQAPGKTSDSAFGIGDFPKDTMNDESGISNSKFWDWETRRSGWCAESS